MELGTVVTFHSYDHLLTLLVAALSNVQRALLREMVQWTPILFDWRCGRRCLLLQAGCREAANCRYCFYSQAKNQVFRPAGATRCTDSGKALQDRRAPGSAWPYKISHQSAQGGGNAAPKYQKFQLFGKESPRRGDSLDRFPKFLGTFIRLPSLR